MKKEIESGTPQEGFPMRLNKFVAYCGLCSRRQAVEYIKEGLVRVNGAVVTEPGTLVQQTDKVLYKDAEIKPEGKKVYLLLNKPKNVITTLKDEKGRKTVMDLIKNRENLRIFPVGRLDRATTGLLVLTNDGDLAKKLSHPSHKVKKIYEVGLDRNVDARDLVKIREGLKLEDGPAPVNWVEYIKDKPKSEVAIEIVIGRNRIVRRIFEHLGYTVKKLDRVYYGGLTKKDLPRGFSRNLTDKEIMMLKHFTSSGR